MMRTNSDVTSRLLPALCLLTGMSFAACGDDGAQAEQDPEALVEADTAPAEAPVAAGGEVSGSAADPAPTAPDTGKSPQPQGAYIASIMAFGTGCPVGTWDTTVAADGASFTTTFSALKAEVDADKALAVKDCTLAIRLRSPSGLAFTLESLMHGGYVALDQGVSARVMTSYAFQGAPNNNPALVSEFVGPRDEPYLLQDKGSNLEPVTSRCGDDTTLNVRMNLLVRNTSPGGRGSIAVSTLPANPPASFKLSWKRC